MKTATEITRFMDPNELVADFASTPGAGYEFTNTHAAHRRAGPFGGLDTRGTLPAEDTSKHVTSAGPTCDSIDILISPLMGAYTTVTSSRFNGIPATFIAQA